MKRQRPAAAASLLSVALWCLAASVPASAERPHSLEPGSWSLQFQLRDNIGLQSFNGMDLSAKRHLSDRAAMRAGVSIDFSFEDESRDESNDYDGSLVTQTRNDDLNSQGISFDVLYVRYVKPGSNVNLFWGSGPVVGFSRREETETTEREDDDVVRSSTYKSYARSWSLGALGIVGAEWFLSRGFSFHAEYRASLRYRHTYDSNVSAQSAGSAKQERTTESDSGAWIFGGGSVLLGLSVYF